jgi:hypothetical protein
MAPDGYVPTVHRYAKHGHYLVRVEHTATAAHPDLLIHHDIPGGKRRAALWGMMGPWQTEEAVEQLISSGLLDRFLEVVWAEG